MKRRKFAKVMGITAFGSNIPLLNSMYIEPNPLLYTFARRGIIWIGRTFLSAVIEKVAEKSVESLWKSFAGSDANTADQQLKDKGYYQTKDALEPKPLPSMPSNAYAAFSYAKKSQSGNTQNSQTLFLGKTHERKEVITLLPEISIYAICWIANKLRNLECNEERLKTLLMPIQKTAENKIQIKDECHIIFETPHGKCEFQGKITRKADGQPHKLYGSFGIFPNPNIEGFDDNEVVINDENNDNKLDFIFS
jgi:hypothetical protein